MDEEVGDPTQGRTSNLDAAQDVEVGRTWHG